MTFSAAGIPMTSPKPSPETSFKDLGLNDLILPSLTGVRALPGR